jgi:GTP cyclohydrolase FolE2
VDEPRQLLTHDLQAARSEVPLGLSRAGVRGIQQAIRISHGGHEKLIAAEIDCTVDLDPAQKGVHMSRFPELFEEAIEEVVIGEALLVESLAEHIARHIVERQKIDRTVAFDRRFRHEFADIGIAAAAGAEKGRADRQIVDILVGDDCHVFSRSLRWK